AQRLEANSGQVELRLESLSGKQERVAEQRELLSRHLGEMQTWHQEKVHELARDHQLQEVGQEADVLPLHPRLSEADQALAQRRLAPGLGEEAPLEPLLAETRKLRCPLRDALLNGGHLTTFQLERLESGREDELLVAGVRLIDELRPGPPEAIYRCFDP